MATQRTPEEWAEISKVFNEATMQAKTGYWSRTQDYEVAAGVTAVLKHLGYET